MISNYAKREVEDRKARLINDMSFDSILDLGCGNGVYLPYLKKRASFVIGLEINKPLVKISHNRGFDVILASVNHLPLKNGCFECVWAMEVVEHLHSFDVLVEMERVASRKVMITLPNPASPHFKRDPTHILHYSVSSLRTIIGARSQKTKWRYVLRGLGFNDFVPTRMLRTLSTFLTWFLPWLAPTLFVTGSLEKNNARRSPSVIDVFAFSILESNTMVGGYRIAIELIRSWSKHYEFVFHVHTTSEGRKMFRTYLGQKESILYDVIWSPSFLTKLCLNHALISIVMNVFMSFQGSIRSVRQRKNSSFLIYSVSPFLSDLLPSLIVKFKFSRAKMFVSHAMFAPSLFAGGFSPAGEKKMPGLRDVGFFINEKLTYTLIKKFADVISETNEIDRIRCIADGFPASNTVTILGGVDLSLSKCVPDETNKQFDCVFVGRLHPQKGVVELIDIWRFVSLKKPNARLALIGNGPLEKQVKGRILKYGLEHNCELFGFKDGIEKIRILKKSRVVVHPALYDSGGMAACEAMACGLPGVSFDLPALRVYYPKGMLKTPCFDLEEFAAKIIKLLDDPILYECVRKDAIDFAINWEWEKTAQTVLKVIESSIKKGS